MSILEGLRRLRPGSGAVGAISNTDIEGTERRRNNGPVIPLSPEEQAGLDKNWPVAITNLDPDQEVDETVDLINAETRLNPFERHGPDDPAVMAKLFRIND